MIGRRRCARRIAHALSCLLLLAVATASAAALTPELHRRPPEQTFLTVPEWYLVHSPDEYAAFLERGAQPSEFPFWCHIGQFWATYGAVIAATRDRYPLNLGYHVMVVVIGVSTTIEYALRSAYEVVIGRLSELTRTPADTAEDIYAARVARDYVEFIRVRPWYEYDFAERLRELWHEEPLNGESAIRKWERRYALTTEYGIKAAYGWLIGKLTAAGYARPLPVTAIVVDALPIGARDALPGLEVLAAGSSGPVVVLVPRYAGFKLHAAWLARHGAHFIEIAGNSGSIVASLRAPLNWQASSGVKSVLFEQTISTVPDTKRIVLEIAIDDLGLWLANLGDEVAIEHIYDY